jgi:hypothetical protein
VIDLSLNEVETIAAKAARGAGLSWGGAEEIGRAARAMARAGLPWDVQLLDLLAGVPVAITAAFEGVALERFAAPAAALQQPDGRYAIAPDHLAALEAIGARTYVPATARSREAGAGAGLTDND